MNYLIAAMVISGTAFICNLTEWRYITNPLGFFLLLALPIIMAIRRRVP